jgi:beta-lactamase regulating signal transducer with metallopeptidase domain
METALQFGLMNVAVAALIAVVAAAASLIRSRPALSHALWLLVILKLLTPPLWGVQIHRGWAQEIKPADEPLRRIAVPPTEVPHEPVAQATPVIEDAPLTPEATEPQFEYPQEQGAGPAPAIAAPGPTRSLDLTATLSRWLPPAAAFAWFIGCVVCAATILVRVVRFHRLLRFAELASPALQGRAAALARRMGMARAARIWFVPGAVSPMLWPLGRGPRVLIPSGLWDRLDESQRRSLLAHELAHLRRRDHWVRLPEVLASVLYWWCPLTWYARRRLREAEEQCCDAWVVWAFPEAARDYASALLETVDFVAAGGRFPLPVLASGMGQFHQLRRRLVMIKHARVSRNLSGVGCLAVGVLAVGLLPLAPSFAQVGVSTTPPATESKDSAPTAVEVAPAAGDPVPAGGSIESAPTAAAPGLPPVPPVAARPPLDTDVDLTIINDLKTQTATLKANNSGDRNGGVDPRLTKAREEARNQVHELSMQLRLAEQRLADLERAAHQADAEAGRRGKLAKPRMTTPPVPRTPPAAPGFYRPGANNGLPMPNAYTAVGAGMPPGQMQADPASRDRRLDAIEANLKALLQEVHEMREKPSQHAPEGKLQAK